MKKTVKFELDWDIRPAMKVAAKKLGQDIEFFANDLLRKALGMKVYQEFNPNNVNLEKGAIDPEFIKWAEINIKPNEKAFKAEKFAQFMDQHPNFKLFLIQKRFSTWINQFALIKGYSVMQGKTNKKNWILLYYKNEN